MLLDHLPQDPCHLISVHLNNWCRHLNLAHAYSSFLLPVIPAQYEDSP